MYDGSLDDGFVDDDCSSQLDEVDVGVMTLVRYDDKDVDEVCRMFLLGVFLVESILRRGGGGWELPPPPPPLLLLLPPPTRPPAECLPLLVADDR